MYTFKQVNRALKIDAFIGTVNAVRQQNYVFNGEMHDFWELVLVKNGKAVATAEDRVYNLSEGQLLCHMPMEFHQIKSAENSAPHLLIVSFKANGNYMDYFKKACFTLSHSDRLRFEEIVETVYSALQLGKKDNTSSDYIVALNRAAVMLEIFLLNLNVDNNNAQINSSKDEIQYGKIINIMNKRCCENLSVDELASICNMSVSNMKRVFARYSDKGIAKHFLSLKIRHAMLLLSKDISVSVIAEELGFASASYFNTVFKRETGLPPGKFRKDLAKK